MKKPIIPLLVKWVDPIICAQRWKRLDAVLERLERRNDLFFIQIGSNDGIVHDPLHRYILKNSWKGILIEPVKYYFELLKQNYAGNHQLRFENIAISDRDGDRDFFRIREGLDFLPEWTKGLGSFNRNVLMKHRWVIPDIQQYIVQEKVECMSFATLLECHQVGKVDLIMIDTEGFDYEIIKQIGDCGSWPDVLIYEHKHFSRRERLDCERLLKYQSFRFHRNVSNTLAYRDL